jgi:hypothetical protein
MATVTFDTLKFVETLKEAGVPEAQAKAFSTAVRESHEAAELATKTDLREYESAIRGDLEKLDIGLRHEMKAIETGLRHEIKESAADLKFELLKWIIGIAIAQAGLLIGLLKFLP